MKKIITISLLILLSIIANAQDKISVVTLKNGTVMKGVIKSIDPNDALTIVLAGIETSIKNDNDTKRQEERNITSEPPLPKNQNEEE